MRKYIFIVCRNSYSEIFICLTMLRHYTPPSKVRQYPRNLRIGEGNGYIHEQTIAIDGGKPDLYGYS